MNPTPNRPVASQPASRPAPAQRPANAQRPAAPAALAPAPLGNWPGTGHRAHAARKSVPLWIWFALGGAMVALVAGIGIAVGLSGGNEQQAREDAAYADLESVNDELDERDASGGLSEQDRRGDFERYVSTLESTGDRVGGNDGKILLAIAAVLRSMQAEALAYQSSFAQLEEVDFGGARHLTSTTEIDRILALLKEARDACAAMQEQYRLLTPRFAQHLRSIDYPADQIRLAQLGYEQIVNTDLSIASYAEDIARLDVHKRMIDLLKRHYGQWNVEPETGRAKFQSVTAANQYQKLEKDLEASRRRQLEILLQMAAAGAALDE